MAEFWVNQLVAEWMALGNPGCLLCDEVSVSQLAIDIVIDGDQIARDCPDCGRMVRPFSWHDDDLPDRYVGHTDCHGRAVEVSAWYEPTGVVRSVPAVDDDAPWRHHWPPTMDSATVARAILAHLVGLDVLPVVRSEFDSDMVSPVLATDGEWELAVDEIIEWLADNR